jgi:hypothetical protein
MAACYLVCCTQQDVSPRALIMRQLGSLLRDSQVRMTSLTLVGLGPYAWVILHSHTPVTGGHIQVPCCG